jgi:hypothetical protein
MKKTTQTFALPPSFSGKAPEEQLPQVITNILPCSIQHDGPVPVSKRYWDPICDEGNEGLWCPCFPAFWILEVSGQRKKICCPRATPMMLRHRSCSRDPSMFVYMTGGISAGSLWGRDTFSTRLFLRVLSLIITRNCDLEREVQDPTLINASYQIDQRPISAAANCEANVYRFQKGIMVRSAHHHSP